MRKPTISIDLDGVLNNYQKYDENEIPSIKQGAEEFIKELSKSYELVLFTTRNSMLATKWLIKNNIDKYFNNVTNVKVPAFLYIDDRTLQFRGNFKETIVQIKDFKVYWKK